MKIVMLNVVLPVWNCKQCLKKRKVWLMTWMKNNKKNLSKDFELNFIECNNNSKEYNIKLKKIFLKIMRECK